MKRQNTLRGPVHRPRNLCNQISRDRKLTSDNNKRPPQLTSGLCKQVDFAHERYHHWTAALKERPRFHRKQWEYFFILQALDERVVLTEGSRGLGFGTGREPLPALFASMGVHVIATDQGAAAAKAAGWTQTEQYAHDFEELNSRGICPRDAFRERVQLRQIDMNSIPDDLAGRFDFCWSACSLEHLGSIQHGLDFIVASMSTLKPGGMAVHTTEFNLSSDQETLEGPILSLFRRRDIETVCDRLAAAGHVVSPIDWQTGDLPVDRHVDLPPYCAEPHLKLRIENFDCTSIGLIISRFSS